MTDRVSLRYERWWRSAGWLMLAVVAVSALMPWPEVPDAPGNLDKYLHVATFLFLTVWFCGVYERWPRVVLGLLLFGAAIELAQSATGYRYPETADMVANAAGIALGLALCAAGGAGWCRGVESFIQGNHRA
ncbi:MAG: VanZ family protein [Gammaproteobacteria bacterium]|jgi:VanZ family protein